ncbi:MAG: oligosaccharide flippase family protein [Clostridia bacterium]
MSRTKKSVKNLYISTICYIASILMSFVLRTIFIMILDAEYLGVNSLFTNILSFLSLAELGIGTAIVYALYKPLADDNQELIKTYMYIYKKIYMIVGCFVAVVGIALVPFLPYLISGETNIENLSVIYVLFVLNSASSYFFSYNQSLLNADQKIYIVKAQTEIFKFMCQVLQIIFLFLTKQYLIYLIISIIFTLLTNISIYIKTMKLYPFLKDKNIKPLDGEAKQKLITNVRAIFLHKIGAMLVYNVDTIIISAFLGLTIVGIYSNYTMITVAITGIITIIDNSVRASLGNYTAKENREKSYNMFLLNDFIWFSIYLFCSVCLINLLNPFIADLWIKDEFYLFSSWEVLIIVANFFFVGLRKNVLLYKDLYGVFAPDRYKPLIEGVCNVVLSLILINYLGFSGVLIATIITNITINLIVEPYVVFKHGLKRNVKTYYLRLAYYIASAIIIVGFSIYINSFITGTSIISFIIRGIICCITFAVGLTIFYFKSNEYKKCIQMSFGICNTIKTKLMSKSTN